MMPLGKYRQFDLNEPFVATLGGFTPLLSVDEKKGALRLLLSQQTHLHVFDHCVAKL